jgi:hypothetical protein
VSWGIGGCYSRCLGVCWCRRRCWWHSSCRHRCCFRFDNDWQICSYGSRGGHIRRCHGGSSSWGICWRDGRGCLYELDGPGSAWAPNIVSVQGCDSIDPFEIDGDRNRISIVQWTHDQVWFNSSLVPGYPQVDVPRVFILFFVEPQLSLKLNVACEDHFAGEVHEL